MNFKNMFSVYKFWNELFDSIEELDVTSDDEPVLPEDPFEDGDPDDADILDIYWDEPF